MKTIRLIAFFLSLFISVNIRAQVVLEKPTPDRISFSLGMGMDYGGLGGNFTFYPTRNLGFFIGGGNAIAGFGYNTGLKYRIIPETLNKKYNPYGLLIYGYNAAIHIFGTKEFNKMFYGPTLGVGFDYRSFLMARGYWSFALLVPIRSSNVNAYMDDLEKYENIEFKNGLFPVAISIGYKFIIN